MKNEEEANLESDEILFDSYISGNQLTLIPKGKIFYTKKEFRGVERERDFWKNLFDSLLNDVASISSDEAGQRQINGVISRFAALAKSAENSDNS